MAELGPDSFSAKVARQPGALPCWLLLRTDLIRPVSKAEVKPFCSSPGVRCILKLSAASSGGFQGQQAYISGKEITPVAICTGWPVAPSQQPWCSTCPAGWASTSTDAASCQMCMPGSFAAAPQSPACTACGNGTYAYSWGSTHCNHCIIGTYAPKQACLLGVIFVQDCLKCSLHVCASHTFATATCVQELAQAGSQAFGGLRACKSCGAVLVMTCHMAGRRARGCA